MVGLNSPFGMIGKIRKERGLTLSEVLWGEPWVLYLLEEADQPRTINGTPMPLKEDF